MIIESYPKHKRERIAGRKGNAAVVGTPKMTSKNYQKMLRKNTGSHLC